MPPALLPSADPSPSRPVRILALPGSVRVGSLNLGLLRAAREFAPPDVDVTIAELADLPLYNQDLEAAGDPAPVQRLKAQVRAASESTARSRFAMSHATLHLS